MLYVVHGQSLLKLCLPGACAGAGAAQTAGAGAGAAQTAGAGAGAAQTAGAGAP